MKILSPPLLMLLLCCLCALPFPAFPASPHPAMENLAERWQILRCGVQRHSLHDLDAAGRPGGGYLASALGLLTENSAPVAVRLQAQSSADLLEQLRNGELDMVCGLFSKTAMADSDLLVSRFHYGVSQQALYIHKNNTTLRLETLSHSSGLKIGFMEDPSHFLLMERFAAARRMTYTPVFFTDEAERARALEKGDIDAVTSSVHDARYDRALAFLGSEPLYFYTTRRNAALMAWLDRRMEQLFALDPFYQARLEFQRFGNKLAVNISLDRNEADYVRSAPPLRVAVGPDKPPSLYFDKQRARHRGVYMDVLRHMEQTSGLRFHIVQAPSDAEALMLLDQDRADIYLDMPLLNAFALTYNLHFTKPFSSLHILVIGRKGQEMRGDEALAVGINRRHPLISHYVAEHFPHWTQIHYENTAACLAAVHAGQCDVTFQADNQITDLLEQNPYRNIAIIASINESLPVVMALGAHHDPRLMRVLNKAIAALRPAEYAAMEADNRLVPLEHTPYWRTHRSYILAGALLAFLALLIILFLAWRRSYKIAYHDALTDLPNRNRLHVLLRRGRLRHPADAPMALFQLEIANLRHISEYYGDHNSDLILRHVARTLQARLPQNSLLFRNSASFLGLCPCPDPEELSMLLTLVVDLLSRHKAGDASIHLDCAVGLCPIKADDPIAPSLYHADFALREGRRINCPVMLYNDALDRERRRARQIELEMEEALENGAFVIYYQPKFDLRSNAFSGSEALTRWKNPDGSMRYYPDVFIPVFEKTGFVAKLDFHVLEHVCATLRRLLDQGISPRPVSVNQSRTHLNAPDYCLRLGKIIQKYAIPSGLVELELTEYTILRGHETLHTLDQMHSAGFAISMDDFGSGYSSLNLLRELPIDILKLDKRFLDEATFSPRTQTIIRHVIAMSTEMHIDVVCEGVETDAQAQFLRNVGCRYAQGYLFSRPISEAEFLNKYYGQEEG